jgi:hypothetical protein
LPGTSGKARSAPTAILQGMPTTLAIEVRCSGVAGSSCGEDSLVLTQGAGAAPVAARCVADPDLHSIRFGPRVPELLQPNRRSRASAGRIDDQVGSHHLLCVTIVALLDPNPGDATLTDVGYQANHVAVLEETHGRQRPHPLPDLALQKRPAGGQPGQADVGPAQPLTRQLPPDGAQRVPTSAPACPTCSVNPGKSSSSTCRPPACRPWR